MRLGFIGLDQYGGVYRLNKPDHPRKQLDEKLGVNPAGFRKMFVDYVDGSTRHIGYVCGRLWVEIHEVHSWNEGKSC